jgi:hypothetical protein
MPLLNWFPSQGRPTFPRLVLTSVVIPVVMLLASFATSCTAAESTDARRPNVVLIMTDDKCDTTPC